MVNQAKTAISRVSEQADSAILFYSGGKDSMVLLDLMAPHFSKIVCVFMYFVKGMKHIQPYLDHALTYGNTEIMEAPHYMLTSIYREGVYCLPNPSIKVKRLRDIDEAVRKKTGMTWSFYGMRQSDSLTRRLMLRGYEDEMICWPTQKCYPLSHWQKADVQAYLTAKRLPRPVDYGMGKQSAGLSFNPQIFAWLSERYPDDLEKIYQAFPFSRQILIEHAEQVPKIHSAGNPPPRNKKRAVQPKADKPQGQGKAEKKHQAARAAGDAGME